jgi:hypothetical protein
MRWSPTEDDREDIARLNAEPWQIALLALNPDFTNWGPDEDRNEDEIENEANWNTSLFFDTWAKFAAEFTKVPDDRNEIVNFYFEVLREGVDCTACDASGLSPRAKALEGAFYNDTHDHKRWGDKITLDEAQALVDHGRLASFVKGEWRRPDVVDTAFVERVNQANAPSCGCNHPGSSHGDAHRGMQRFELDHDAINRGILIETRCKRLGIEVSCNRCEGHGDVFTAKAAHVRLVLWMLHPGKGASRFVAIERLARGDQPAALALLAASADRNLARFGSARDMKRTCAWL